MATLYDTLGVHEHATEDEIKRAYRKAAMKWHPDRNAGREDAARAAFQEIKQAYGILSDPAQREVYDAIFAEEMRRWKVQHEAEERLRAEREAKREAEARRRAEREARREAERQAAAEAAYAEKVALAMRFAGEGYNRDVVFGVLLGQQCERDLANRIADSAIALHAARQAEMTRAETRTSAPVPEPVHTEEPESAPGAQSVGGLWYQFLNTLRF